MSFEWINSNWVVTTVGGIISSVVSVIITKHYMESSENKKRKLIPKLQGRWEYEVTTINRDYMHKGWCEIEQNGRLIKMNGVREYTAKYTDEGLTWVPIVGNWHSDWAEICDDGNLRLEYNIRLNDRNGKPEVLHAVARMKFGIVKEPKKMQGTYFTLPPFGDHTLNCLHGSLVYIKTPTSGNAKLQLEYDKKRKK
jgi:hypothetical protein